MKHILPSLPYDYNELEPYIDEQTMRIHHGKHHQTYVDKLNIALEKYPEFQDKSPEELIKNLDKLPKEIRTIVQNHGGGHLNHSFFWPLLKRDVKINKEIKKEIDIKFGSFDKFKEEFSKAATSLFGSGWTWLVVDNGNLEIINTANQDSPLSLKKTPILCIDLWEHAMYLKYQNRRADYISAFFNVINWDNVNELYERAVKRH